MTERQILHKRFLKFFDFLEEQAELSKDETSKSFIDLVTALDIDKRLLLAYIKSEHLITFLEAYKFCKHFNLNEEEMFADITNYIDKIATENDLTIDTEINAVGGHAVPALSNSHIELKKIQGYKGGTVIINVTGDSMSPIYNEGERVVTEKLHDLGDIKDHLTYVFALEDGTHKIKKVMRSFDENGKISGFIFISNNPKYKQEFCPIDEIQIVFKILRKIANTEINTTNKKALIKKRLKDLISESSIKKVILILRDLEPNNNELIVYQSQFTQNNKEYRKGEIEISSRDKSNARIISGILEYIDDLSQKEIEKIDMDTLE
jgi:signal peptidase I